MEMATTSVNQKEAAESEPILRSQDVNQEPNMIDKQAQEKEEETGEEYEEEEEEDDDDDEEEKEVQQLAEVKLSYYLPLQQAARDGDWKKGKEFIDRDTNALTAIISVHGSTALHVAATYGRSEFVEKIAQLMPVDALAIQNLCGDTALHLIAGSGTVKAAKVLVGKKPLLTQIVNHRQHTPLDHLCATMPLISSREREMLWYLSRVTKDEDPCLCFSGRTAPSLMLTLFSSGHFDLCLYLLQRYPNLAKAAIIDDGYKSIVWLCAGAPEFPSGIITRLSFMEYCIYKILPSTIIYEQEPIRGDIEDQPQPRPQVDIDADVQHDGQVPFSMQPRRRSNPVLQWFIRVVWKAVIERLIAIPSVKKVYDIKLRHQHSFALLHYICQLILRQEEKDILEFFLKNDLIYNATKRGVVEIIGVFLRYFPDLMEFYRDDIALLHVAVENRRENVFNLLMELSAPTASIVFEKLNTGSNILHLAAKLAPSHQLNSVSGPALQMQRELQWFKEVEKLVPNMNKRLRQKGKTPQEVFTKEHEELKGKGEKWMRDTSNSAMVVTTLIATIAFAAAITVPGDYDDIGTPNFLKKGSFMVFAISDALALFSSVTSLIMFLAILTARYAEEDFLESLPRKMIIGLSSLFVAIAAMMISFGAALSILLGEKLESIFLPLTLLSCVPVALFGMLQLPLLIQMFQSTYGRSIFYRPGDHIYRDIAYKKVN